ncbi:hypothetical protein K438DRAFT_1812812 [Mycena galopus ATCC 62051]|nr:hypothetical protein K438DRAFT_1812812 [Mycena galopus ATCC 62051]
MSIVHPFSSTHLSLPFKMLLDNVICRFFTWQLVRYLFFSCLLQGCSLFQTLPAHLWFLVSAARY